MEGRATSRLQAAAPEAHTHLAKWRCDVCPPGRLGAARVAGRRLEAHRSFHAAGIREFPGMREVHWQRGSASGRTSPFRRFRPRFHSAMLHSASRSGGSSQPDGLYQIRPPLQKFLLAPARCRFIFFDVASPDTWHRSSAPQPVIPFTLPHRDAPSVS
jgi:hypothetical protein